MVRKDCFGYDARCGARKTDRCTALTKLIPKAPVHRTPTSYWDDEVYECPICQNLVGMDDLRINYCDTCGQALEWKFSEEEDE